MKTALCIASHLQTVIVAFAPQANNNVDVANMIALNAEAFSVPSPSKSIFDPLGLYPQDSPERAASLIEPLESSFAVRGDRDVLDPLRLYQDQSLVSSGVGRGNVSIPPVPATPDSPRRDAARRSRL